jgi:hypothetical protein
MRVITADGETINLGDVETTPTIGITDYSRRETDDFGVTTVVERGFSRKMSVKIGVPFDSVDALQRRLSDLRATPALWVADDRLASLSVRGFYKEFELDLAVPPLSYCTLTVEGLAEGAAPADVSGDPAPAGLPSTLQLLQPVIMTDSVLAASNVAENDAGEWAGATSYPIGARVMRAATHRIYESLVGANAGNDPAGVSGKWLDVGPTNRWAMFDQALGTSTSLAGTIVVTLDPGTAGAVALLDVAADTVRVQANGYDRTLAAGAGAITFLDLPAAGQVTVTIAGTGMVSVGTLLVGRVVLLGITESSPTAGITDFSKKTVDDFGEVTIVQRAWTKRMTAKALIRTDAIDAVANRIAAVRARPSLWIGQAGLDSLTIYGFFKDFAIEVGETLSKLSLSIEGFSAAAKVQPLGAAVDWEDIADPTGTKPADGATVGAPGTSPVGNLPANRVVDALAEMAGTADADAIVAGARALVGRARAANVSSLAAQLLAQVRKDRLEALTHLDGIPVGTRVRQEITQRMEGDAAIVQQVLELSARVTDEVADATALIREEATLRADADSAETEQRELAISSVELLVDGERVSREAAIKSEASTRADAISAATEQLAAAISAVEVLVDGERVSREAAITSEASTRADAISAATEQLEAAISAVEVLVGGERVDREAAISSEASTRADAISAATEQLQAAISAVEVLVNGEREAREAAITEERTTSADEAGAIARSVTDLGTRLGDSEASITFLLETIDGEQAVAQLSVNVKGQITGFKINGKESLFTIAADRFVVGNSQIFEVDTLSGVVKMNSVEVRKLAVGSVSYLSLAGGSVFSTRAEVSMGSTLTGSGAWQNAVSYMLVLAQPGKIVLTANAKHSYSSPPPISWSGRFLVDGEYTPGLGPGGAGALSDSWSDAGSITLPAGTHNVTYQWNGEDSRVRLVGLTMVVDAAIGGV